VGARLGGKMVDRFLHKVKTTIEKYRMLASGDVVLVGVSGGPDSIALLHILYLLKEEYRLTLFVVHVNHMFRGEQARREAQYVAELAQEWGLGYRVLERDIPRLIHEQGLSPQDAGHQVRKKIFQEIGQEIGAQKLALGHHAEDRAETVLLHLIQGTGPEGLAGMPPVSDWIIRPLAQSYKEEIIDYCRSNNLNFFLDPSNTKPVYLRNKIRLKLLPYLKEEFNPQMVESLVRLEDIVVEENRYLEEQSHTALENVLTQAEKGKIIISTEKLAQQNIALQRRVIRKIYNLLRPEEQGLSFTHVRQVLVLTEENKGTKKINLPQGIIAQKSYDRLEFWDTELKAFSGPESFHLRWDIPGSLRLPNNMTLTAGYTDLRPETVKGFFRVVLDGEKITPPLTVRTRKPGDRIQPLGMAGTKKLKDIFIDLKIAREERDSVPLVCDGEEIIWLPGITINDKYKIGSHTKCYLQLELVKDEYV